jgi:hypothetical protein
VTELLDGARNGNGDLAPAVTIALEQVERHALRGLRPDSGQAPQRLDQAVERRWIQHRLRTAASCPAED